MSILNTKRKIYLYMYLIGRICKNLIDYKISTLYTDTKEVFMMKKFFSFIFCSFVAFVSLVPCAFANFPNNGEIIHLTLRSKPGLRLCAPYISYKASACGGNRCTCSWLNEEGGILGCDDSYGRKGHWVAHLIDAGSHTYILQNYETYKQSWILNALSHVRYENTLVLDETVTTGRVCCWSRHDGFNQQWIFEPVDSSLRYFRLRNRQTGNYLVMCANRKCISSPLWMIGLPTIWEKH